MWGISARHRAASFAAGDAAALCAHVGRRLRRRARTSASKSGPFFPRIASRVTGRMKAHRQADLRLDERDVAVDFGAIVPGAPDDSELVRRITSDDRRRADAARETGRKLTAEEIEKIKQWIAAGAEYSRHWSYEPPQRPRAAECVASRIGAATRSTILCWRGWSRRGLQPEPEADRHRLIRRLSLDLIGLPPTLEEVDAFVADDRPDAYERLVDRLLASPAYGEHWARKWLDLARYADTTGYEKDTHAQDLAVSRLGHQRAQRRHAVRPVHDRAARRRSAAQRHAGPDHRHGVSSQHDAERRRRHGRRRIPRGGRDRSREHDDASVDGHDDGLLPVPYAQVRSASRTANTTSCSRSSIKRPTPTATTRSRCC